MIPTKIKTHGKYKKKINDFHNLERKKKERA